MKKKSKIEIMHWEEDELGIYAEIKFTPAMKIVEKAQNNLLDKMEMKILSELSPEALQEYINLKIKKHEK